MDAVEGKTGDVVAGKYLPIEGTCPHQSRGGVHDATINQDGGQGAEDAEGGTAALEPSLTE